MTTREPGIYDGIPESEYFAGPELSASGAKRLLESPARYRWDRDHPMEPSRAMIVGSALHTTVLGVGKPFRVIEGDGRNKAVKDAKAEADAAGELILTGAEGEQVERMADAIHDHRLAAAILSAGHPEQSVYWTDEATGVHCRSRLDWYRAGAIADLKSAITASETGFGKHAANLGYEISQAAYQEGVEAVTGERLPFLFLVVEKAEPHFVAVHELPDEAVERGRRLWRQALETFAACTESGHWPAYDTNKPIVTAWPRWAA